MLFLLAACSTGLRTERFVLPEEAKPPAKEKSNPAPAPADRRAVLPAPPKPLTAKRPGSNTCTTWQGYLPDPTHPEYLPLRHLRVNFHILNSRDSSHNFKPEEARRFFTELLRLANADLDTNIRNWRSPDGTAVLPKRYRYELAPHNPPLSPLAAAGDGGDGFYFHFDDSLYYFVSMGKNQNNYDRQVIDRYSIGADSILNIFVQVHPDDSIRSPYYRANGQGIALGNALKMAGIFESKGQPGGFVGLMNHEIGHILGLSHAWVEDGCPDTQNHPNKCWAWTPEPPCNDLATNNMMDYNAYQVALTPCQIGRIQANFANEASAIRRCLRPDWCLRHPESTITIRDSVQWLGARDLEGDLVIAPGGQLRILCRVSMPPGSRITVQPGGLLVLDNARLHQACGKSWAGIFVEEKKGLKGEVRVERKPVIENVEAPGGSN